MKTIMNIDKLTTITELEQFLDGSQSIAFSILDTKQAKYSFVKKILIKFQYTYTSKMNKGVVRRFLIKITGYSRQQLTRLIRQYNTTGHITHKPSRSNGFSKKYTKTDVRLLVEMDKRHENLCGHATKKLFERAYVIESNEEYKNLSVVSVSQIYNMRHSSGYQKQRRLFTKTQAKKSTIGTRQKPRPYGAPGYIRIDSVHQGDQDKKKGVYHINAVDEVTQFEVVCSVEKISEAFMIPALKMMLNAFPFVIKAFHSDNGSEYINRNVLSILDKLNIEFTKSRSRHSNDNALAESKNASIVRKQFGYQHIPQKFANKLNEFNFKFLYPYINFHRPCFFPEVITDEKGKEKKKYEYKNMMTPYEKLKSLPNVKNYLKKGISFEILDKQATELTDNACADLLKEQRILLFNQIFTQDLKEA
jgi:hypothetical protein